MLKLLRAIYIALVLVAFSNASSIGARQASPEKTADEQILVSSALTTHGLDNNNDKSLVKSRQSRCVRCYEDQYQRGGSSSGYYSGKTYEDRDRGSSNWYYYDRDRYDDRQRYAGDRDYNRYDDREHYSETDRYQRPSYTASRDSYDRRGYDPRDVYQSYGSRGSGYDSQRGGYDSQRGGYDSQRGGYDSQRAGYDYQRGGYDSQRDDYQRGGYETYRKGYGGYEDRYGGRDTFYDRDRQTDTYDRYGSNRYRNNYYPYDDTYRPQQSTQHYPSNSQSTPGPPYIPNDKSPSHSDSNSNSNSNDGGSSSTSNSGNWKYNENQNNDKQNKQSQYDNNRDRDRDSQSSSYGGRRPLGGSYLLDRDSNDPQKAVNNEKPSDGSSMAMAQTMESKDEKKE